MGVGMQDLAPFPDQGEITMFAMDVPPDVPAMYAPVVIAQAQKSQPATAGSTAAVRTIGVCQLIENPPIPPMTAANVAAPAMTTWSYLTSVEKVKLSEDLAETAKTTLLDGAKHGVLVEEGGGYYRYDPTPGYYGTDRATVLVEMGNYKVKVVIHFKVMQPGIGGTEGYDPYMQKENCPKGPQWKISQIAADFGADDLLAWQRSAELSSLISSASRSLVGFTDLAGFSVSQTTGEGSFAQIVLDTAAWASPR
jgi:hypothetical protein